VWAPGFSGPETAHSPAQTSPNQTKPNQTKPNQTKPNQKTQVEKFIDGRWQVVAPADRLKLTQADGQVWLALHNLLLDPACRWGGGGGVSQ
jgi:hypothetical protein